MIDIFDSVHICRDMFRVTINRKSISKMYSETSLLRSPMGLGKSDLNGEVTVLEGVLCTVEYNLRLNKSDRNGEVAILVR